MSNRSIIGKKIISLINLELAYPSDPGKSATKNTVLTDLKNC